MQILRIAVDLSGNLSSRLLILAGLAVLGACSLDADYSPAHLDDLRFEGAATALNPAFQPDIFRYSVIQDEASNSVNVTAFANARVTISINDRIVSSGVAETIDGLTPGDVVRIDLQNTTRFRGRVTSYEILYLPSDFPLLSVTTLENGASTDPLYVTLRGPRSNYMAILDNHGVPAYFRRDDQRLFDFKWHATTGERSFMRFTGTRNEWGRRNTEAVILDADFDEVERLSTVDLSHTDQHDFLILPNDEVLLLSYDGSLRDLSAYGLSSEELVEPSVVQIIDRMTRSVLFEWSSWDHLPFDDQTYPELRGEYAHVNSAFVDSDSSIIISARGLSQVVKIARPSGQVVWKLGGKSNQFTFLNDPFSQICGQHTASILDNGNLLLFDNGQNCWPILAERGDLTRVVEYRLDEESMEAELVWSYSQEGAYSTSQGSAQRLENGNTLIGWGRGPGIIATEVNAAGEKVFEIVAFDGEQAVISYRAQRFPE